MSSKPPDPPWSGVDGEYAVVVPRQRTGRRPDRTDLEIEQAVADQARRYLAQHTTRRVNPVVLALMVQLIAGDHLAEGRGITVTREDLLNYLVAARRRLNLVREHHDD